MWIIHHHSSSTKISVVSLPHKKQTSYSSTHQTANNNIQTQTHNMSLQLEKTKRVGKQHNTAAKKAEYIRK